RQRTYVIVRKSRRVEPSTSRQSHRRPLPFATLPITARTGASNRLHCTFYSKSLRSSRESRNASRSRCGAALLRATSRGGSEGDPTRSARKRPPPHQNRDPPRDPPPFLTSHRCRARAWTHVFSLALDRRGPKPATVVAARIYKCGDRLRSERFRSAPTTRKHFRYI